VTELADLTRSYRVGFLRYLARRDEAPLNSGYELGRSAVAARISVLDLARVHHEVFLEVLRDTSREDLTAVARAASEYFLEVLATYDMAQRGFLEGNLTAGSTDPDHFRPVT
jgi:hypothetical protein